MARINDQRSEEEKEEKCWLVVGTDSFMSGWGEVPNGNSYAAWACSEDQVPDCDSYVRSRSEMKRVRTVHADGYNPGTDRDHLSICTYKG